MNIPAKLVSRFVRNDYVTAFSLIVSFIGFGIVMRDVLADTTPKMESIIWLIVTVLFFACVNVYSLRIRMDNQNLEEIAKNFREINSIYRETLFDSFWGNTKPLSMDERLVAEKNTLKAVCQIIGKVFSKLLHGKECTVTVKLLTEESGISYATTYVRNYDSCERDKDDHNRGKYEVNTGRNPGFDQALKNKPTGQLSYFHSADLTKESGYANQRIDYLSWYKSTIIVPIRCPRRGDRSEENYGFLTVDTMTRHRLNNQHHVVMLSALAEQIFNFMALMRGNYKLPVEASR